ncbi:Adenylosuccinate synthetase [Methylacidimicrobium sp. AP8]|uniref:adenylosuccinate synthase n=1 Tax=Methylacidimicrobium sp. AP8 TaxID=2730359 RepID=UPI0018C13667|nr:Adenylosuccinate synthetase [Methylacidimicrobium sp. AP8]
MNGVNTVVVGAQWGDEGKGKVIDFLTEDANVVVRCQGGDNAGHTVEVDGERFVVHLIPSGILRPEKQCVLGNGMVIDPTSLVREIKGLTARGIAPKGRLFISEAAHLVLPYHRQMDEQLESLRGKGKLGTTGRGVGPAYVDKANRTGLRVHDLLEPKELRHKLEERIEEKNRLLSFLGGKPVDSEEVVRSCCEAAEFLREMIVNTAIWLSEAIREGKDMLFESAQGTFLDIDFGTYPYVTSSNTTAGGAVTGTGVPPHRIDRVIGCLKAYTTRVGAGPMPVESAELSDLLHRNGREFGATTGRARRCGWFDGVMSRYACLINGFDELAITNLDGLDTLATIPVCVAYEWRGRRLSHPPTAAEHWQECVPIYKEYPGWLRPTSGVRRFGDLPDLAKRYLDALSELTGSPVGLISVGAGREQTFLVE